MSCDLMSVNGLAADCTESSCIYWAKADDVSTQAENPCALQRFRLLGNRPDRLAYWLLELKLKTEAPTHSLRSA